MRPITIAAILGFFLCSGLPAEDGIVVRGLLYVEGQPRASVELPAQEVAKWMAVGDAIGPWVLKEVDFANSRFVFAGGDGEIRAVELNEAVIKDARDAWIRSTANPMFFAHARLPPDLAGRWPRLSGGERARIEAYYRNHGWIMEVLSAHEHGMKVKWSAIHQTERNAELRRRTEEFRATLAPNLAEALDATRVAPAINFAKIDPANPPRNVFGEFLDSLPPDRRAAWDEMMKQTNQAPEFELPPG